MCPQRFAPKSYDATKLATLQKVFDQTWELLAVIVPDCTKTDEERIKTVLAKAIVQLSIEGVFDRSLLFKRSLKSVLKTVNGYEPRHKNGRPRTKFGPGLAAPLQGGPALLSK